jgi:glucose-6-phosphate isomerase
MLVKKYLHDNHDKFTEIISKLEKENFSQRILEKDYALWSDKPDEIVNRLDWVTAPTEFLEKYLYLEGFADDVIDKGITEIVLLGMGGSSLAPEVFQMVFGNAENHPHLTVLDSTHPESVLKIKENIILKKTLFIVSTKSGGTVETLSFLKYFYNLYFEKFGDEAGKYFVAITDAGSKLEQLAEELNFFYTFINNPNVGGRFSALTYFGLVPAAVIGVKIPTLLKNAKIAEERSLSLAHYADNNSYILGALLGMCANKGKDKLTFVFSEQLEPVGAWIEQLVAESTGKNKRGILPVVGETLKTPANYSKDRLFVYTHFADDTGHLLEVKNLVRAGFPVIEIILEDLYELGNLFYTWEYAVAVAGHLMKIHPFDQPDVESAKVAARKMVAEYLEKGTLPTISNGAESESFTAFYTEKLSSAKELMQKCFENIDDCFDEDLGRSYIALQAFLPREGNNIQLLSDFQNYLSKNYKVAVTVGFGPRFLHSTGQLHKGDLGNGIFIQFTDKPNYNLSIPDNPKSKKSGITFDVLVQAQGLGDREALVSKGRKILRLELKGKLSEAISELKEILGK